MFASFRLHRFVSLIAVATALCGARATEPKLYFTENFKNYRDIAPRCDLARGISLGNDAIHSQQAQAICAAETEGFLFTTFVPETAPRVTEYEILFRFRFQSETNRHVRLVIRRNTDDGKSSDLLLDIYHDRVALASDGVGTAVHAEADFPSPILRDEWHLCAVTLRDGQLTVSLDDNRLFYKALTTQVPVLPLKGINFEVFKDAPFAISDIQVREPAPLPDRTVAGLLPAPKMADATAFTSGGTHTVPISDRFGATLRTGAGEKTARMEMKWNDGSSTTVSFGTAGMKGDRRLLKDAKRVIEEVDLADAMITISGLENGRGVFPFHVRPLLKAYRSGYTKAASQYTDMYHDIVRDWDLLPSASAHPLKIEFRRVGQSTDLYLDGSFATRFADKELTSLNFELTAAAAIGGIFFERTAYDSTRFLPLDIAAIGMAKSFSTATASLPAGPADIKGVPLRVASGADSGDVGLVRQGQGTWGLECDAYLCRSPFDGFLTELHFSVPGGVPYTRAWVLCAVDPDATKDPVLSVRLAHYYRFGSGNNWLGDTTITLPRSGEEPGEGIEAVGSVAVTREGREIRVPLYLVSVPLNSGRILDLMMDQPRLSFEFLGKLGENFEQFDHSSKPDPNSTSAVQIFGVTLEKSSVGLAFEQSHPANVFHNDETPETTAILTSLAATRGRLSWSMRTVDGTQVDEGGIDYNFAAAGQKQRITIPLAMPELGWYGLDVRLEDAAGKTLLDYPAAFALLGQDTRQAGMDSPYGVWWFGSAHNSIGDLNFAGPVMVKAGLRIPGWAPKNGSELAVYKLYKAQTHMPFGMKDFGTSEEMAEEARNPGPKTEAVYQRGKEMLDAELLNHRNVREVLIFHESGPANVVPVELLGVEPKLSAHRQGREQRFADYLNLSGAFLRKYYPQLKTVVGNHNCSAGNMAAVLRHGGKEEYIDYIGIEAASQVIVPEKLQEWGLQGQNIATDIAKTLSGRDIPVTGCYEFTFRADRDMGEHQQAEWYTRDMLIGIANNYTRIGPGALFDAVDAYYNNYWGCSGLLRRGPGGYPKASYVAYAVLTEVFDRIQSQRQIPTGTITTYALEATRADGQLATALWASRGTADYAVDFGEDAEVTVVEMYGKREVRRTVDGKLTVTAGTSPAYLLTRQPIRDITLASRAFPKDAVRAAAARKVVTLDAADLELVDDPSLETLIDPSLEVEVHMPVRQSGIFALRNVEDAERGACIEVELQTAANPDLNKYITEYAVLRLKKSVPISGEPVGVGVWVRGNSNWGRILFELEDAEGEVWRSIGTGDWGCDILDWPGNAAVNFDGWNFVSLPLANTPLFNDHSPGPVLEQWVSDGDGNKRIDYPVRLRGLIVEMNRTPLDLLDFKPVSTVIAIQDVCAF